MVNKNSSLCADKLNCWLNFPSKKLLEIVNKNNEFTDYKNNFKAFCTCCSKIALKSQLC